MSLVTLAVDDLARADDFYVAMGWQRSRASVDGEVTFLRGGSTVLALYGRSAFATDAGVARSTSAQAPAVSLAMNVAGPEDVAAVLARARDAGGSVTAAASSAGWGGTTGAFVDTEGHLWEVAHNPAFPLLDDGRILLPDEDAAAYPDGFDRK